MANVVFVIDYVQNENVLSKNKALQEKYGERRAFYSSKKAGVDYLGYVDTGAKEQLNNTNIADYIGYSGNEEKSSGAFNQNGLMNRKEKAILRESLRNTQSVIWHGIISFEQMFGKRYMENYEDAQKMMSIEFPRFLKSAGLDPNNIEWYAGLHENTDNKHIHFSFFEKEPSRYRPHQKGLQFSRGKINKYAFEWFKIRVEQRLTDISSEIKCSRKELTDITKSLLFSPSSSVKYQQEVQDQLFNLMINLPTDGRVSYDSQNMEHFKPQVNRVIDCLIKLNPVLYEQFEHFSTQVKSKDSATLEMLKSNKIDECKWGRFLVADKYLSDIYRRLGNQIIKSVKSIKGKRRLTKNRLANKRINRQSLKNLVDYTLRLNSSFETETLNAFQEFLYKLDRERTLLEEYEME